MEINCLLDIRLSTFRSFEEAIYGGSIVVNIVYIQSFTRAWTNHLSSFPPLIGPYMLYIVGMDQSARFVFGENVL